MKVVLDTNVIIAAFATRGLCHDLFEACLSDHEIVLCRGSLLEVKRNLIRKLKLPPPLAEEIVAFLEERSVLQEPLPLDPGACRDPSDLMVLGVAAASGCDCIVTGDQDLLSLKVFRGIPVLAPRDFWKRLGKRGRPGT